MILNVNQNSPFIALVIEKVIESRKTLIASKLCKYLHLKYSPRQFRRARGREQVVVGARTKLQLNQVVHILYS